MRFGIVILPEYRWSEGRHLWRRAEDYGFDHAWTYDHLGWRDLVDGPWFDAVPTLAAAAGVTTHIQLGTHVASANYRHPAAFAREVTTLDDLSTGRFLLGVGAGGKGFDEWVLGQEPLDPTSKIDRYVEFVELLKQILENETTSVTGAYFSANDARSTPGPFAEKIPFIIAGNATRSIQLAARRGDAWMTTGQPADDLGVWWTAVSENVKRYEQALDDQHRDAAGTRRYLSLDAAPTYSLESLEAFSDFVGRADELGFTDVVAHWPRRAGWYAGDEGVLEAVATKFLTGGVRVED